MLSEEEIRRYLRPIHGVGRGVPLDQISALAVDHACQLGLCDVMERLADALPEIIDIRAARFVVLVLRLGMPGHSRLEEEILFPLLRRRSSQAPELPVFLAQLEQEHAHDHEFANEIAEELEVLINERHARNGDMLGYMLRGYFTAQRRHIQWENATVVPLARRVLAVSDLAEMDALVASHHAILPARRIIRSIVRNTCAPGQADAPLVWTASTEPTIEGSGYA